VLDVGCSVGALGASIKAGTGAQVTGIEYSRPWRRAEKVLDASSSATPRGDRRHHARRHAVRRDHLCDVLEHLPDPWLVLRRAVRLLSPGGRIIASLPNIRHLSTIYTRGARLLAYRDRGIHDRTHLRFFTAATSSSCSTRQSRDRVGGRQVPVGRASAPSQPLRKYFALPGLRGFSRSSTS